MLHPRMVVLTRGPLLVMEYRKQSWKSVNQLSVAEAWIVSFFNRHVF